MKLRALSSYDGDLDTRFGDCILIYDSSCLVVYDCGHDSHANKVGDFLKTHPTISQVNVVFSHNDSDHTDGGIKLLNILFDRGYTVTLYTSLYLKSTQKVLKKLDDNRRNPDSTKKHILELFDHIAEIVNKAQEFDFTVKNATEGQKFGNCEIVGPTEDEFCEVVAKAIEDGEVSRIDGETVMNAASVQMKAILDGNQYVLLCGDASPEYLHNLNSYKIIQLPHHGKLDSATAIFDKLYDSYSKEYLVSDNTGSATTSGGSEKLVEYMQEENYAPAWNTKKQVVDLPTPMNQGVSRGVRLGAMDTRLW